MRSESHRRGLPLAPWPRRFALMREFDVSAVSGVGRVADGVQFTDGSVALRWHGYCPSTAVWRDLSGVVAVHGHGGLTEVWWLDPPSASVPMHTPDRGRR
jgi:hypothetical protein